MKKLDVDFVEEWTPPRDIELRLFGDFASQALDDRFAVVDDPAGRTPVGSPVLAPVTHEQDRIVLLHHCPGDFELAHSSSIA